MACSRVEECPSSLSAPHTFSAELDGSAVRFEVLKLEDSILIWVGLAAPEDRNFSDLSVCMAGSATKLLGNERHGEALAQRFGARLNKPVFFSLNVPQPLVARVEARIIEEVTREPHCF